MSRGTEVSGLIRPTTGEVIEFFGPTVEFLTSPEDEHADFCMLKGTIRPGMSVPLHAHAETEDFIVISGSVEALQHGGQGYTLDHRASGRFHSCAGERPSRLA